MARRMVLAALAVTAGMAGCSAPTPPPRPAPSPTAASTIPAALQGRYALKPAACDLPASATPAQVRELLTIGPDALAFGVDQQSVDRIAIRADRVVIDTSVAAEGGAVESRRYAFRVAPDHGAMTRVETNHPDLVYTRCPNQPS